MLSVSVRLVYNDNKKQPFAGSATVFLADRTARGYNNWNQAVVCLSVCLSVRL